MKPAHNNERTLLRRRKRRGPRGRPTEPEIARRKQKILEVATALFLKQGYAETSLIQVARISGVSTRTIYQHFGPKTILFEKVLTEHLFYPEPPPLQFKRGETLKSALGRAARQLYALATDDRSKSAVRLLVAECNRFPSLSVEILKREKRRQRALISELFFELVRGSRLPTTNLAHSEELFIEIILGTWPLSVAVELGTSPAVGDLIDDKVEMFIGGYLLRRAFAEPGFPQAS